MEDSSVPVTEFLLSAVNYSKARQLLPSIDSDRSISDIYSIPNFLVKCVISIIDVNS
jgi:hypothetical protein